MCGKPLGSDYVFAWPTAEIAVMGAEQAAEIVHRREIQAAPDQEAKRQQKITEYRDHFSNPYIAAARGFVDAVISPTETRPRIIDALEMLATKRETRPAKKHGNIPV